MYDIFLYAPCKKPPDLTLLKHIIPRWRRSNLVEECMSRADYGFLGFSFNKKDAIVLLRCLQKAGGGATVARVDYRTGILTPDEALHFAQQALAEMKAQLFPHYTFNPLLLDRETATTWIFCASSPQFLQEGYDRDTIYVPVDKIDGHIWQEEYINRDIQLN